MKIFLLLLMLLCTSSLRAETLIIGTTPFNPPFTLVADNSMRFFGFDIDIMMEICKRIDADCRFTPILFGQLLASIKSGRIDVGIGAIILTASLLERGWLPSLPYLESSARFLTMNDSKITMTADIANKTVGTKEGTLFTKFVREMFGSNIKVKTYQGVMDMLFALQNNLVDVILTDGPDAEYLIANNSGVYRLVGDKMPLGAGYAIVSRPEHAELIQRINRAIIEMETDGTYLAIYNRYFNL